MRADGDAGRTALNDIESFVKAVVPVTQAINDKKTERLVAVVRRALAAQSRQGWFGPRDEPRMRACYTAQTLDALSRIGFTRNTPSDAGTPSRLEQGFRWLKENKNSDGVWGEDLWDTCEVVRLLLTWGISHTDPVLSDAVHKLRDAIDTNWAMQKGSEGAPGFWFGACFPAGAAQVFADIGDNEYFAKAFSQLESMRNPDGSYGSGSVQDSKWAAPNEWHTAAAILAFEAAGSVAPDPANLEQSVDWLRARQNEGGYWSSGKVDYDHYLTRLCILALASYDKRPSTRTRDASEWLLSRCETDNYEGVSDVLMALSAISQTHSKELVVRISIAMLAEINEMSGNCSQHIDAIKSELSDANEKLRLSQQRVKDLEKTAAESAAKIENDQRELRRLKDKEDNTAVRLSKAFVTLCGLLGFSITIIRFRTEIWDFILRVLNVSQN